MSLIREWKILSILLFLIVVVPIVCAGLELCLVLLNSTEQEKVMLQKLCSSLPLNFNMVFVLLLNIKMEIK